MNPSPTNLSRASIEALANDFASKVAYEAGKPLEPIVTKLRGEIHVQDSSNDGEIEVREDGTFSIFLSPFTARVRDRFTVAHELGHYVLHSQLGQIPIKVPRSGTGTVEVEANLFAAALLMPENAFRDAAARMQSDGELAAYFDVSTDAVRVRKQVLKIRS